ncbi:hypothetical protein M758_UG099900 [Ceratodon purpureus]|nr:hypothetical protein M758_UG099900 [Ceratodon purpureus]
MSASWHSLLVRIGERCPEYGGLADAEDHVETCFGYLARDLAHSSGEILALLMQCVEELPHKDPLYGALVGLINTEDREFVGKVVDRIHAGIQEALDTDNCNKLRILTRFLTVLMCNSVVSPAGLIELYEALVSSAAMTVDEDGGNPAWQARADFYVFCILASLPWGGVELSERVPEELDRVLNGVEAYLNLRKPVVYSALQVFEKVEKVEDGDDVEMKAESEDYLENLWGSIQTLMENSWKVDSVPRPHQTFENRLVNTQSHDFDPVSVPDTPKVPEDADEVKLGKQRQEAERTYPRRNMRLRIFPASKTDEKITPIDRFVVEEYLLDVLFHLNGCRKECAAYMVGLPVPFRYEYIMAETVFSQLLLLPKPPFRLIYYTVVMVDLCKALPGAFPAVVAGAVRALFKRVSEMDVECRTRLVQWLSHHLSNFQFVWPWEEWAYILELPKWAPERVFAKEVLEKEVRLAYWEKVKDSVATTPKLIELLPPKNTPLYVYALENKASVPEAEAVLATELTSLVRGKKTVREIQVWIDERILPTQGQQASIQIVAQTLLYIGSKSFTHTVTVLEKYGQIFRKIAPDQASQIAMIDTVSQLWRNSAQMTAIVIDRMMGYRMVSNLAIVAWVFGAQNVQQFHTSDQVWEILRNAINKTNNRTVDLRREITAAEDALKRAVAGTAKAHAKWEAAVAASKAAEAKSEDSRNSLSAKVDWAKTVADKAQEEETSAQDSLESKEALLERAEREQEALFLALYQNFADLLTDRLSKPLPDPQEAPKPMEEAEREGADAEAPAAMEADEENVDEEGAPKKKPADAANGTTLLTDGQEEVQWRKCTLGYLRALSRQYGDEVWRLMEKLDSTVFTEKVHPLVISTTYAGLQRSS